jgi:NADPH-dependent 2,4-dienoyl-CoA reductase/sulfur reductase-like enzyme/nitrite reductase/ring-hydroxylating ferredoxin subunit
MGASEVRTDRRDFAAGLPLAEAPARGVVAGHVAGEPVLLWRDGETFSAVGGACTHYGGPLAEGLVVGDRVHCPWHHACFSLRTGEALAAPAFDGLTRWKVEIEDGVVFVRAPLDTPAARATDPQGAPGRVVIVGGGAAGFAAAEMLRRRGFAGSLIMLSADDAPPCDRPNLSKDYLAGAAPEEWIPLRPESFYADNAIDLRLNTPVVSLDLAAKAVVTGSGERIGYDTLLLATGAEPIRLNTPGFDRANVHTLRSLADSRAIIAAAQSAKRVAVIGASFIGLEAAASLRARGLETHVVGPETVPMEKVLGRELGEAIRGLHEAQGVIFHLGQTGTGFDGRTLTLSDGGELEVDLLILGVGVRPRVDLAQAAGLEVDHGVLVDAFLQTSAENVFAAGDIASYPDPRLGERVRVEHWVVAERQGQVAALNILGERQPFDAVPFFWSKHYDTSAHYVGHATGGEALEVEGSIADWDATIRFRRDGRLRAAVSVGRDLQNLEIEAELAVQ